MMPSFYPVSSAGRQLIVCRSHVLFLFVPSATRRKTSESMNHSRWKGSWNGNLGAIPDGR